MVSTAVFSVMLIEIAAQPTIRAIWLDQRDVFDSTSDEWFFAAPLANALHTTTRPWIVADELLFTVGDQLDTVLLYESERNLRRLGLFSRVEMIVDTIAPEAVEVTVLTQDLWSTTMAVLAGSGGGIATLGGKLEEFNLGGTEAASALRVSTAQKTASAGKEVHGYNGDASSAQS